MKIIKIISAILVFMIAYDFALHMCDIFRWSYAHWGPAIFFSPGTFIWGSSNYTIFWTSYWGLALILSIILTISINIKSTSIKYNIKKILESLPEMSLRTFIIWESCCIILLFIFLIIYPSYMSYMSYIDKPNPFEKFLGKGEFGGYYIPYNDTIILLSNSTFILRHELCHRYRKNITENEFKQEIICNIKMYFIWKKVNLTTLDWEKLNKTINKR